MRFLSSILTNSPANSPKSLESIFEELARKLMGLTDDFVTIMLIVVGMVAITVLVWALAKKRNGEQGANDTIMNAAFYTFVVVAFILIIKALFFKGTV